MSERVNPIRITDQTSGEVYELDFNKESVKFAEGRDFVLEEVTRYPVTKMPELFYYAFRMHHKNVSREKTDRILFDDLGGMPDGMAERLGALYGVPFEALTSGEEKPKNPRMTVEF